MESVQQAANGAPNAVIRGGGGEGKRQLVFHLGFTPAMHHFATGSTSDNCLRIKKKKSNIKEEDSGPGMGRLGSTETKFLGILHRTAF